jgi:hypothetical protein
MLPAGLVAAKAEEDGMTPPWTAWWDPDEIAGLFPSAEVRAQIEREQPRLPLSCEDRANAAARGWPVRSISGEHLHILVSPRQVADDNSEPLVSKKISCGAAGCPEARSADIMFSTDIGRPFRWSSPKWSINTSAWLAI